MPSEISSLSRRWNNDATSSSRPPQYGQRRISRVVTRTSLPQPDRPIAHLFEQAAVCHTDGCSPEIFETEPSAGLRLVNDRERIDGAHLRAMTLEGGELAGDPRFNIDRDGWRFGLKAERVRDEAPESRFGLVPASRD